MFFRDWLLRHPPTSVLLVLAFLALLMGLFPGSQRPAEPTRIQETIGMDPGTATVTTKALDLAAQIDAVFSAPIPFFLALVAILGMALLAMWRALEWAYRMRLEKADFYIKMAGQEHALREQIDERIAELDKKSTPSAEAREAPSEREELIHRRRVANNAVTANLDAAMVATSSRPGSSFIGHAPTVHLGGNPPEPDGIRKFLDEKVVTKGSGS